MKSPKCVWFLYSPIKPATFSVSLAMACNENPSCLTVRWVGTESVSTGWVLPTCCGGRYVLLWGWIDLQMLCTIVYGDPVIRNMKNTEARSERCYFAHSFQICNFEQSWHSRPHQLNQLCKQRHSRRCLNDMKPNSNNTWHPMIGCNRLQHLA